MSRTYRTVPTAIENDLINNGKDHIRKIKSFDNKHQKVTVFDGKAVHDFDPIDKRTRLKSKIEQRDLNVEN